MNEINILSNLFIKKYGFPPIHINRLPGAGSNRTYYRLEGERGEHRKIERCIGVVGENHRDNLAFIRLSSLFRKEGCNVPEVYASSENGMCYIQEDLGNQSLFSIIKESESNEKGEATCAYPSERVRKYVKDALSELVKMQTLNKKDIEDAVVYAPFALRQVMWDLNYFKYEYLKPIGVDFNEERLEDDFENFAEDLMTSSSGIKGFMYRDFQSRNIMVCNDRLFFIDFQGGRIGPGIYDAVSFLWQAKAGFTENFRMEMLRYYAEEYERKSGQSSRSIMEISSLFVLFRILQVLGAYGFRGLIEKKAHFIESIPPALDNLAGVIKKGVADKYPELKRICGILIKDIRFNKECEKSKLTIEVFSFSYKKGYPADYSGNGGGFMFDCRGMHNPGRYQEYKQLTGLDEPVIQFLKEKGETDIFSDRAFHLIEPTVERYLKRGFTNLQIGFGCTGGQHRSVYCAERVSRLLADRFPDARIKVVHREQGIKKELN